MRAEALATIAADSKKGKTRETLEQIATEYLKMARQMDELQIIEDHLHARA
jgi:hypothetical protein